MRSVDRIDCSRSAIEHDPAHRAELPPFPAPTGSHSAGGGRVPRAGHVSMTADRPSCGTARPGVLATPPAGGDPRQPRVPQPAGTRAGERLHRNVAADRRGARHHHRMVATHVVRELQELPPAREQRLAEGSGIAYLASQVARREPGGTRPPAARPPDPRALPGEPPTGPPTPTACARSGGTGSCAATDTAAAGHERGRWPPRPPAPGASPPPSTRPASTRTCSTRCAACARPGCRRPRNSACRQGCLYEGRPSWRFGMPDSVAGPAGVEDVGLGRRPHIHRLVEGAERRGVVIVGAPVDDLEDVWLASGGDVKGV